MASTYPHNHALLWPFARACFVACLLIAGCSPAAVVVTPTPIPVEQVTAEPSVAAPLGVDIDDDDVDDGLDRCVGAVPGASEEDDSGCPTQFDYITDLDFDSPLHRGWYERFWTGSCQNVSAFCVPGSPAWNETVATLTSGLPADQASVLRFHLWVVGQAVGYDWSRDNSVRTIVDNDLRAWNDQLTNSQDLLADVLAIEQQLCTRLGADTMRDSGWICPTS